MIESPAILIDTTLCKGCERCVAACKEENDLNKDRPWSGQGSIDGLSASRYSTVLRLEQDHFVLQQCRHCLEPACVSACLVGAMQRTPEGPVIYDADRCMGCRYCLLACPFGIPRYEWASAAPLVHKCTMCYHRQQNGNEPACVEACPEQATVFGPRAKLLQEAHRRLAAEPHKYVQRVWGEHEVGGTSVLYISDIDLGFLGWSPRMAATPLPELTWASLEKVPPVILGMTTLMVGLHWVIGRRMKVAAEQNSQSTLIDEKPTNPDGDDD